MYILHRNLLFLAKRNTKKIYFLCLKVSINYVRYSLKYTINWLFSLKNKENKWNLVEIIIKLLAPRFAVRFIFWESLRIYQFYNVYCIRAVTIARIRQLISRVLSHPTGERVWAMKRREFCTLWQLCAGVSPRFVLLSPICLTCDRACKSRSGSRGRFVITTAY